MYDIPSPPPTKEFVEALKAVAGRIEAMAARTGMEVVWLRTVPSGLSIEHLSFFCGGQAFFLHLFNAASRAVFPCGGTAEGLLRIARGWRGFACVMPLRPGAGPNGTPWEPALPDWSLLDAVSGAPVQPEELALAEPLPVTAWECHDFAVQAVRQTLVRHGVKAAAWNSDPEVQPAIWIAGPLGRPEWAAVGEALGSPFHVPVPDFLREYALNMAARGLRGWWAPVGFSPLVSKPGRPEGRCRGEGASVDYRGLMPLPC